jgi:hypothetical protein
LQSSVKTGGTFIFDGRKCEGRCGKPVDVEPGIKSSGKYSVKNVEWRDFDGTFWIPGLWMKRFFPSKGEDLRFLTEDN